MARDEEILKARGHQEERRRAAMVRDELELQARGHQEERRRRYGARPVTARASALRASPFQFGGRLRAQFGAFEPVEGEQKARSMRPIFAARPAPGRFAAGRPPRIFAYWHHRGSARRPAEPVPPWSQNRL